MTHTRSGFTLVELLVTLAIASLMLAVVPVSMIKLYENMQYRSAVRDVMSALKGARAEAMQTGMPVPFTLDPGSGRFDVDGRRSGQIPGPLRVGMIIANQEVDRQQGSIRFYPDGGSTGGTVVITRPNGAGVRLTVDWLLGRVSQTPA